MTAPTESPRKRIHAAAQVWPFALAPGALQLRPAGGPEPEWVAVVPGYLDRPSWVPAHATRFAMREDTAYVWSAAQ